MLAWHRCGLWWRGVQPIRSSVEPGLGDVLNDEGPLTRAAAGTFLHRLTETMPSIVAIIDLGA